MTSPALLLVVLLLPLVGGVAVGAMKKAPRAAR